MEVGWVQSWAESRFMNKPSGCVFLICVVVADLLLGGGGGGAALVSLWCLCKYRVWGWMWPRGSRFLSTNEKGVFLSSHLIMTSGEGCVLEKTEIPTENLCPPTR